MLIVEAIHKRFPTRSAELVVLRDASLTLEPGQSAAIMGPSGSGKSTLLNIIGTLEPPSEGRITLDGADPFMLTEGELARFRNGRIGFVFQEHHLLPQCSVLENVLLPTLAFKSDVAPAFQPVNDRLEGLSNAPARARDLLDRVGLADRLDHRPAELSGGERPRVAVARALINRPALVLADEPPGNLDRANADTIADLLAELPGSDKVMLIVVTHSERLAGRFAHRFDLVDGKLVASPLVGGAEASRSSPTRGD